MSERSITVQANSDRTERVTGTVFAVISSTGTFDLTVDNEAVRQMSTGRKVGSAGGREFTRLRFRDTSGADNTIRFYAGDQDYDLKEVPSAVLTTSIATSAVVSQSDLVKTVVSAGSAVAVSAATLYFRSAIFLGRKAYTNGAGGDNVDDVYLGVSGAVDRQPITIPTGGSYIIDAPTGSKLNLAGFYIDAVNAGDGVVVIYFQ